MSGHSAMRVTFVVMLFAFVGFASNAFGQNVPEEAKRHFSRGMAAVEMAKKKTDYEEAIREFQEAAVLPLAGRMLGTALGSSRRSRQRSTERR